MNRTEYEELRQIREVVHNASPNDWTRRVVEARDRIDGLMRRYEDRQAESDPQRPRTAEGKAILDDLIANSSAAEQTEGTERNTGDNEREG